MSDLQHFKHELGRELVGAAHRQRSAAVGGSSRSRWLVPAVALSVVIALAAITIATLPGPFGADTAVADVFVITERSDRIELEVVDVVSDPTEVERQLREELGFEATLRAVASDPQIVGEISLVGTDGSVAPEVHFNDRGTIERVVLPVGLEENLIIEYGRPAEPGEAYVQTVTSPLCARFHGVKAAESLDDIMRLSDNIRYHTLDERGAGSVDVEPSSIPSDYVLVNIFALSDDSYLATYASDSPDRPAFPVHPNCE